MPIFSYYTGMDSTDGIIYNAVEIVGISDPEEAVARGESGWGYTVPQAARFDTDSSYIITAENVQLSYIGDHTLSGEIWVRPYRGNGVLWTWGDTSGANFLRMSLKEDCSIRLERSILDSVYVVDSGRTLDTNRMQYIRWVSEVLQDTLYQSLWINGQISSQNRDYLLSGTGFVILRSPFQLGGVLSSDSAAQAFSGEIHAATLTNVLSQYELSAYLPYDGSRFSGIPYYWDYDHWKSYTISPTPVGALIFVPYVHDDFVPQGLTNSFEDPDFSGDGMIFISMYNKTINNVIGLKRSIVVEMDPGNHFAVRRCFRLRGQLQYSHNGGIAYKNNRIYIAGSGYIEAYQIPVYDGEGDAKYQDLYPMSSGLYDVEGSTSFTTIFNDTLWVGDFREEDQSNPYLRGYPLDSNGAIGGTPKYYRLPLQTQGCTWGIYAGRTYLFTSISSGGTNNSLLHRFDRNELSVYAVPEPDRTLEFPSGAEDISFDGDGDLWCVSESGAKYYQLRDSYPWRQFFPFIYEIKNSVLFSDIDTTLNLQFQQNRIPSKFSVQNYPNPFNQQTVITYSIIENSVIDMVLYDICGRELSRLVDQESKPAGSYQFVWHTPELPTGIYFILLSDNHGQQAIRKLVFLK
ncbi:MAG: T9SS type A sorting domain-containing protein [Fidelibacterota bacterium]